MNFTDTSECVCVGGGASVTERERELEINQTSTRLRETQPSYQAVARKWKPGAESTEKTGSGLRRLSNNNIVYTQEEPLLWV